MIHRYFFWIEDKELELYDKNGKSVKYKGEKKIDYSNSINDFFESWKNISGYDDEDFVDFTFIGEKKKNIQDFINYCEIFSSDSNKEFTFEDLKSILDDKNLKKFCVETESNQYFLQKTEFNYNKIPKDLSLKKIYVFGKNIKENLFSKDMLNIEIQTKTSSKSEMASFFTKRLK